MRRYYQELELGQLDPAGVAASVWDALTGLLGRDARGLAALPPPAPAARRDVPGRRLRRAISRSSAIMLADAGPTEPDEVDRLFGVDPSD